MWNGNMNSNTTSGGGGRQTPRLGSQNSDESAVHDVVVQPHLAFQPAYNPMTFYPPYYEYPTAALQHQRIEIDMLTAAAHLQQQQIDYERTRAALSAAQVLRGRVGGLLPEDLPVMMEDEARLQTQSILFPPTISSLPPHLGYNVYSSLDPSTSPGTVRMVMNRDQTGNIMSVLPQFSAIPTPSGSDVLSNLFESNEQGLKQTDDLENDPSVLTFSSKNSQKANDIKLERATKFSFSNALSMIDAKNASSTQTDIVTPINESPMDDVLTRLDSLPGEMKKPAKGSIKKKVKPKADETEPHENMKKISSDDMGVTPKSTGTNTKKASRSSSARSNHGKSPLSSFYSSNRFLLQTGIQPAIGDSTPHLTAAEYINLDALMTQFCAVPYLAEFSRPLSVLHPDMISSYSKVIRQPIDLGMVCRRIHQRMYRTGRAVCLDVWRVFSNCIKFHTHPSTRDISFPSFVSIAAHLSEYFTSLWLEYMLPSDPPNFPDIYQNESLETPVDGVNAEDSALIQSLKQRDPYTMALKNAFEARESRRLIRIRVLGPTTFLTPKTLVKISNSINSFVSTGGSLDVLDTNLMSTLKEPTTADNSDSNIFTSLEECFKSLRKLSEKLVSFAALESDPVTNGANVPEYSINDLRNDLLNCHSLTSAHHDLSDMILTRIHRLLGKVTAPIYEINNRGVNQSSIWGCSAAVIWARESSKRPYWPAIVIGVLAPDDQKEPWHQILTDVNEMRLPEKLRVELSIGKKKAEVAIQKQSFGTSERMSYFLVEFLGSHEFTWVKEADIIEKFDPNEDPNSESSDGLGSRKKKNATRSQTPTNMKSFQKGVEEGQWALEELDIQMTDPCGDMSHDYYELNQDRSCSYVSLCTSDVVSNVDEETRIIESIEDVVNQTSPSAGVLTDLEEINELIATNGLMDYSADGRKNAKKRASAMKRFDSENKSVLLKRDKDEIDKKIAFGHVSKARDKATIVSPVNLKGKLKTDSEHPRRKIEQLREDKEILKRRKKRERERERVLKEEDRKSKKQKTDNENIVRIGRRFGFVDKRGRARAVVRGYLHRLFKQDDNRNILTLDGMSFVSTPSVESASLLGLAVIFRAVAREIEVPSTGDCILPPKPWDKIDAETPLLSDKRCECLEKKIALIEKAIKIQRENNDRRRALIEDALSGRETIDLKILSDESMALTNDIPKKKLKVIDTISDESFTITDA